MINKVGGNAGKDSVNYRISLPAEIIHGLGVEKDNRGVILEWDSENKRLVITKNKGDKTMKNFKTFLSDKVAVTCKHDAELIKFLDLCVEHKITWGGNIPANTHPKFSSLTDVVFVYFKASGVLTYGKRYDYASRGYMITPASWFLLDE